MSGDEVNKVAAGLNPAANATLVTACFPGIVSAVETARLSPLEPLAKAYQRAVPEHPADDGLFGPRSMVWRVNRDRCFPLAGMRSLMVQALHPLAMAGAAQHSHWRPDPLGRPAP